MYPSIKFNTQKCERTFLVQTAGLFSWLIKQISFKKAGNIEVPREFLLMFEIFWILWTIFGFDSEKYWVEIMSSVNAYGNNKYLKTIWIFNYFSIYCNVVIESIESYCWVVFLSFQDKTCFEKFLNHEDMKQLHERFIIYHILAPGQVRYKFVILIMKNSFIVYIINHSVTPDGFRAILSIASFANIHSVPCFLHSPIIKNIIFVALCISSARLCCWLIFSPTC